MKKYRQFFRQINVFAKEVTKELISRKIFERDRVLSYFSTLCILNSKLFSRKNVSDESKAMILTSTFTLDISNLSYF